MEVPFRTAAAPLLDSSLDIDSPCALTLDTLTLTFDTLAYLRHPLANLASRITG